MFQCFEVKPEDDNNDDKPSTGVFASSGEQVLLVLLSRPNVHSMQSVILFYQFCTSVCPDVTLWFCI